MSNEFVKAKFVRLSGAVQGNAVAFGANGELVDSLVTPGGGGGGGSSTWTGLTDTPASYAGKGGYLVQVNPGETALTLVSGTVAGAMLAATYDPTMVGGDVFDMDNMVEGTTTKIFTSTERTKLANVASNAIAAAGVTYGNLDANGDVGTSAGQLAVGNHTHATYIAATDVTFENLDANSDVGTGATQVAAGDHTHAGVYQPVGAYITASGVTYTNLNNNGSVGTGATQVSRGNHTHTASAVGLGSVQNILSKFDATVAPDANNDSGEGYAAGSYWVDITNDKAYVCLDATVAAAVWTETTQTATGASPGGSDTFIQFNDGGSTFGGDAGFTYDKSTDIATLVGGLSTDDITERTATAGVTVDGVLLKDNGVTASGTSTFASGTISDLGTVTTADINGGTLDGVVIGGSSAAAITGTTIGGTTITASTAFVSDTISESTPAAGVTIDGLLVKDSGIPESAVTAHAAAIDHDALLNFVAAEHIDWKVDAGADNIHVNNITAVPQSAVTTHETAIDHNNLNNYVAAEHTDWTATIATLQPKADLGFANVLDSATYGSPAGSDWTAVFQAAYDSGLPVLIPYTAGGYQLDSYVDIDGAQGAFIGLSVGGLQPSIVGGGTKSGTGFRMTGGQAQEVAFQGLEISNFEFAIYQADTVSDALSITVKDCEIHTCLQGGVYCVGNTTNAVIAGNYVHDISRTNAGYVGGIALGHISAGTYATFDGHFLIDGNRIDDLTALDGNECHGIHTVGVPSTIVHNSLSDVAQSGTPDFNGDEAIYIKSNNSKIIGNTVRDGGGGQGVISVKGNGGSDADNGENVDVSGNVIYATTATGAYIGVGVFADNVNVHNNHLIGLKHNVGATADGAGVYINNAGHANVKVHNNTFTDCEGNYCIHHRGTGDGNEIVDNTIENFICDADESGETAAIYVAPSTSSSRGRLTGNSVSFAATPLYTGNAWGIRFVGTAAQTYDNWRFSDNTVRMDDVPVGVTNRAFEIGTLGTMTSWFVEQNSAAGTYDSTYSGLTENLSNRVFVRDNIWQTAVAASVIPEILLPVPAYGESGNEPVTAVVGGVPVQDFADGDTVLWPFTVPEGFEDSAPVLELVCAWDATTSGNFNLSAAIEAKGAGATLTTASYDTTNTQGTSGSRTTNVMLVVSITLTNRDSWTAGNAARCKLTLDTDTMGSGGLRLISARVVPGA